MTSFCQIGALDHAKSYSIQGAAMFENRRNDEGFTGLEAAIVLIAFVVVAAVFSYVILGAGFYTTQKSQETIYKGVEQSTANIQMIGNVYGLATVPANGFDQIRFSIGLAPGASDLNLEKMTVVVSTPTYGPTVFVWSNGSSSTLNTNFVILKDGAGTSRSSLSAGDQMEIRLNLTPVQKDTRINIEIRPGIGAALPFSKTTPAAITGTSILY